MKNAVLRVVLILGIVTGVQAQIGIGNANPTSTLDIGGTVRVTNIPPGESNEIVLTGSSPAKFLNRTNLGANLLIVSNTLETAPVSGVIGVLNLGDVPIVSGTIQNLDLEIASGEINSNATFIKLHSYSSNFKIAGIINGVDGRHFTLFFTETVNIGILEDDPVALPQNRIKTAAISQLTINGMGFVDLVYDADAGQDGLGRWLVIKFRG
tara:strand:- start:106 stop:735 length:630 start_codon:yes stop_codon:yes gene_type:complete